MKLIPENIVSDAIICFPLCVRYSPMLGQLTQQVKIYLLQFHSVETGNNFLAR